MTNLVAVPEDGTENDVLVARYSAAWVKVDGGRAEWIEGTLELAAVVLEAKRDYPHTPQFSLWLERNNLRKLNKDQRSALLNFAEDPATARILLESTASLSWDMIWRERKQKRVRTPPKSRPSTPPLPKPNRVKGRPGRKPRLPDVMQEDNEGLVIKRAPAAPVPERPVAILKGLKPHEVDPNFKGTSLEFITQYGHVNLHTKEEIEENQRRELESIALGAIADWVRTGEAMEAALAKVDLTVWLSRPAKAEKWEAWCRKGERAYNKLRVLKGC